MLRHLRRHILHSSRRKACQGELDVDANTGHDVVLPQLLGVGDWRVSARIIVEDHGSNEYPELLNLNGLQLCNASLTS